MNRGVLGIKWKMWGSSEGGRRGSHLADSDLLNRGKLPKKNTICLGRERTQMQQQVKRGGKDKKAQVFVHKSPLPLYLLDDFI